MASNGVSLSIHRCAAGCTHVRDATPRRADVVDHRSERIQIDAVAAGDGQDRRAHLGGRSISRRRAA
jgi:hypothetical protein